MALLTTTTVARFLRERGFPDTGSEPPVELGGGVSNVVFAVRSGGRELVVKQALPSLRVAAPWAAKRERALTEAAALSLAHRLTPDSVPRVFDMDEERCALVIERAPAGWRSWKALASQLAGTTREGEGDVGRPLPVALGSVVAWASVVLPVVLVVVVPRADAAL